MTTTCRDRHGRVTAGQPHAAASVEAMGMGVWGRSALPRCLPAGYGQVGARSCSSLTARRSGLVLWRRWTGAPLSRGRAGSPGSWVPTARARPPPCVRCSGWLSWTPARCGGGGRQSRLRSGHGSAICQRTTDKRFLDSSLGLEAQQQQQQQPSASWAGRLNTHQPIHLVAAGRPSATRREEQSAVQVRRSQVA
jgi:hypothetical protein